MALVLVLLATAFAGGRAAAATPLEIAGTGAALTDIDQPGDPRPVVLTLDEVALVGDVAWGAGVVTVEDAPPVGLRFVRATASLGGYRLDGLGADGLVYAVYVRDASPDRMAVRRCAPESFPSACGLTASDASPLDSGDFTVGPLVY